MSAANELERLRADLAEASESRLHRDRDCYWRRRTEAAEAERDALKAAIAEVRRLQEMTIAASCRVQAIDQAHDTLAVLDRALAAPESHEDAAS